MSLGSFMTAFTPPAGCLPTTNLYWIATGSQTYWLSGEPYQSTCFPSGYEPDQNSYYTPATACPASYTPACSNFATAGTATETQVTCCPQMGSHTFECKSTKTSYDNPWGETLGCMTVLSTDSSTSFITVNATLAGTETAGKALTTAGTILAYGINIRYEASDLVSQTTASTGSTASSSGATSTSSSEASGSSGGGGGLSKGAAAGIGVGVGVAGLAILAAVVYLVRSRRQKQWQENQHQQRQTNEMGGGVDPRPLMADAQQTPKPYTASPGGVTVAPSEGGYYSPYPTTAVMTPQMYTEPVELPTIEHMAVEVPADPIPVEKDATGRN
ncbi:hypothetical protein BX600DRAFT_443267 [Xylariales sp. PMI_506]|nr:hypothetical protein BX600DRAFT_443267 [Xylariales sp. PMI_506]